MLSPKTLKSGFTSIRLHYSVDPTLWSPDRISSIRSAIPGWRWMKEYEIDFSSRGGQKVYDCFDPIVHVAPNPIDLSECLKYKVIDHGRRNPTACLWFAEDKTTKTFYFYREYYRPDATIAEHCRNILQLQNNDKTQMTLIDPSTHRRLDTSVTTIADEYARYGIMTFPADNNLTTGIEEVTSTLMATLARWSLKNNNLHPYFIERAICGDHLREIADRWALYFHPSMDNTIREMHQLMWDEFTDEDKSLCEQIKNVDDHCTDCVRYAVMKNNVKLKNIRSNLKKI